MCSSKNIRLAFWILLSAFCAATASAAEPTILYEAPVETNAPPHAEVVVELGNGEQGTGNVKWPKGADRLYFEIWCADESEEPFSLRVNGGRGKDGKLRGFQTPWGTGIEIAGIDPFDDCDFCREIVDFDKMS